MRYLYGWVCASAITLRVCKSTMHEECKNSAITMFARKIDCYAKLYEALILGCRARKRDLGIFWMKSCKNS